MLTGIVRIPSDIRRCFGEGLHHRIPVAEKLTEQLHRARIVPSMYGIVRRALEASSNIGRVVLANHRELIFA